MNRIKALALGCLVGLISACGGTPHPGRGSVSNQDPGHLTTPFPIRAEQVIEGTPEAFAQDLYQSADKQMTVAYWSTTAGQFTWNYTDIHEVITILEGEAFVTTSDGQRHHLRPGVTMAFAPGDTAHWHVPEYIRKVAVIQRAPRSVLRKLTDRIKHWAG